MMKSSTKMMCYMIMIMSTTMVVSSNNWINMWMGLEINLMSFIPIMFETKNNFLAQAMMTYFLAQALASLIFLMTILQKNLNHIGMTQTLINLTMIMKMGLPPFQSWLPQVMENIKWESCLILMTWQKIAPMYIMSMIKLTKMTTMMIILSIVMGSLMGLNQTSMRKIMAYSSMTHGGWMMASMKSATKTWILYLMIYTLVLVMLCLFCAKKNLMNINQMSMFNIKLSEKLTLTILMLSMGGIPPFIGFMPKWIVLSELINSNEFIMMTTMVIFNLLTLFYYLRMTTSMNLLMNKTQKWNMTSHNKLTPYMLMINLLTPMATLVINFF